jgi:hypothetical protein
MDERFEGKEKIGGRRELELWRGFMKSGSQTRWNA